MAENQTPETNTFDPVSAARRILRMARSGSLATLNNENGAPFASRVIVATDVDGSPLLLLSDLAVHTQNLKKDPRASLLLCNESGGDPMRDARISVNGRLVANTDEQIQRRFLARHPAAVGYAGFADFVFYRLDVDDAHLVADFGRIHTIAADSLLLDLAGADALIAAEAGIIEHMNADHADAIALYATKLLDATDGDWTMSGCDPEGIDLLRENDSRRLVFEAPVGDAASIRKRLVALVAVARGK